MDHARVGSPPRLAIRSGCGSDALRPRSPRHAPPRNVLPAERLRPLARPHPTRGRARIFLRSQKPAFLGRDTLLAQKQHAILPHKLCALRVTDKSPPIRSHYRVFVNGEPVTETTSGALSPSLGYGIALAYLPPAYCDLGQEVQIEVRDRRFRAEVVKKPFLKKP